LADPEVSVRRQYLAPVVVRTRYAPTTKSIKVAFFQIL
jgi:hypothetical protein